MAARGHRLPLVTDTLRAHRGGAIAWVVGGFVVMYAMALAIEHELSSFPGGPKAFAASVRPGIEALRILRWPADRLDTLGGYLMYHNVTVVTLALSLYAAIQGARAVRDAEDHHSLEEVLATGWSRAAVIRDRTLGFLVLDAVVSLALGLGVAVSLAVAGRPDLSGSLATLMTSGLCAMVAWSLGLLMAQLLATSRAAAGVSAAIVTGLDIATNVWDEIGPFGVVRFVSPFHFANSSRAMVPGHHLDVPATVVLVGMSLVLLAAATWAFARRDYGTALWVRRAARRPRPAGAVVARLRAAPRAVWSSTLSRARFGLLWWALCTAAVTGVMAFLQESVLRAWAVYDFLSGIAGGGARTSPAAQYTSVIGELITPILAAYVITQASGWVADLAQGRVEVVLAAPMSWSRLVLERLTALGAGVAAITLGAFAGFLLGGAPVGAGLQAGGMARLAAYCLLLGAALGAVAALVVAALRTQAAVLALALFMTMSYLLTLLVPLFGWPESVGRLSVFTAFGHPYLAWPPTASLAVLLGLAVAGTVLATVVAERTPKVARG